jgi:fragile X mental retardation protein
LCSCLDESSHKGFQEICGNAVITYRHDEGVIVVLSSDQGVVQRAQLLGDLHLRYLQQRRQVQLRTNEIERRLQNMKQQSQGTYHEEVKLRQDLVGLAIGSHGNNILTAKRIPGITAIELEEGSSTFRISGEVCAYSYKPVSDLSSESYFACDFAEQLVTLTFYVLRAKRP